MRVATSSRRLSLASHVRACHSDGQVILLDLRRNKYLGIGSATSDALADHVKGWPGRSDRPDARATSASVTALTQRLAAQGLLTNTPGGPLPDITIEEATLSLDCEHAGTDSGVGARRLGRFVRSAAVAALWLQCCTLHSIAKAVAARRERLQDPVPDSGSLDAMRDGTAAYEKLRPFAFTAQDRCLHDSLALVGFLASEGVFPRWVIGVKTRPFGAHSWVQYGGSVLNDQHENVRRYSPILVV